MNTRSNYGTRNSGGGGNQYQSGRYNNPGTFIPAVQQPVQQQHQQQQQPQQQPHQQPHQQHQQPQQQLQKPQQQQQPQQPQQPQQQQQYGGPPRHPSQGQGWATDSPSSNITPVKAAFQALPPPTPIETDEPEVTPSEAGEGEEGGRKKWMKKGVAGFKVSMRERRRRQNRQLRRLITPKNALMVLNELTPGSQHECTVQPEVEAFTGSINKQYVAVLNVEGIEYRGTGPSKLQAKNHAAEGVIRDMIIRQMGKFPEPTAAPPTTTPTSDDTEMKVDSSPEEKEDEGPTFPMIQLASYALHKLFSDWHTDGYKVPSLGSNKVAHSGTGAETPASVATPTPKPPRKTPVLPPCPEALHPCVLLSQMKGALVYSFLACEGVKPNGQIFSMGVVVDGTTFIGKAPNKKEARKRAAQRACETIFNIVYPEVDKKVPIEDM